MKLDFMNRATKVRRSPIYRVLSVLPTPARPWLLAFEALTELRLKRVNYMHERKEAGLQHLLDVTRTKAGKKKSSHWGLKLLGLGLAYAATRLTAKQTGPELRSGLTERANTLRTKASGLVETTRTQGLELVSSGLERVRPSK